VVPDQVKGIAIAGLKPAESFSLVAVGEADPSVLARVEMSSCLRGFHLEQPNQHLDCLTNHKYTGLLPSSSHRTFKGGVFLTYETKWKQTIIKSFRLSPALLASIEAECRVRGTQFSEFMRYAAIAALKPGRYQATGH
jgi:hypothetical protein